MRRYSFLVALAGLLLFADGAMADPPNNGYIGIFGDAAGTTCCINMNVGGHGTLYVFAVTGGATSGGIMGAEFRVSIEPSHPTANFSWNPAAAVLASTGDPVDNGTGGGVSLSFDQCQTLTGMAGDKILLGTITVNAMKSEHQLVVRPHENPSANFACPSMLICDAPDFSRMCLTLQEGDPDLFGQEPVAFTAAVNSPSCTGVSCGFVAVEPTTWTRTKSLFR